MNALTLNPRRLGLLMKNDIVVARTPAIMLAAACGTVFVLYFLTAIGGGSPLFSRIAYPIVLMVLGFILSSASFAEIHETRTGAFQLTSPGSLLEKYLGKVLLTSVGWTVVLTLAFMATTALGALLTRLVLHTSHGVFLPNRRWVWETVALYLVNQSIFILGSIYFRKAAFLKTLLWLTIIATVFGIFFMLVWRGIYWNAFTAFSPSDVEMQAVMDVHTEPARRLLAGASTVGDVLRWSVVPIFFWVAGYLRLRETEV